MKRAPLIAIPLLLWSCNVSDAALGSGESRSPVQNDSRVRGDLIRIDLGTLGGSSSYASAISNDETVVGWSETASGDIHAFRWSAAKGMVDLGTLPGDQTSRAVAVRNTHDGMQILGVSGESANSTPVVWSGSGSISVLPIYTSPLRMSPTGFNARGQVIGWDPGGFIQQAWIWSREEGKYGLSAHFEGNLGEGYAAAITESGRVLVTELTAVCPGHTCRRTYIWTKSTGYVDIGAPGSAPITDVNGAALNENGTVIGSAVIGQNGTVPFRWDANRGFTILPRYSGVDAYGYAMAVNEDGTAVGAALDPSGSIVASEWSSSGEIGKLSEDANTSVAVAIANSGAIAGWATVSANVNHAMIWRTNPGNSRPNLVAPSSSLRRATTASSSCLNSNRAIVSRDALFDCVIRADRTRSRR